MLFLCRNDARARRTYHFIVNVDIRPHVTHVCGIVCDTAEIAERLGASEAAISLGYKRQHTTHAYYTEQHQAELHHAASGCFWHRGALER